MSTRAADLDLTIRISCFEPRTLEAVKTNQENQHRQECLCHRVAQAFLPVLILRRILHGFLPSGTLACFLVLCFTILLAGCGSVGEPLYPALNIPMPVTDLSAVERGDKLDINFTIPPKTTEGLLLKEIGSLELRIGPHTENEFRADAWAASAKRLDVPLPAQVGAVHFETSTHEFIGKDVVVAARVGNARGRMSQW